MRTQDEESSDQYALSEPLLPSIHRLPGPAPLSCEVSPAEQKNFRMAESYFLGMFAGCWNVSHFNTRIASVIPLSSPKPETALADATGPPAGAHEARGLLE